MLPAAGDAAEINVVALTNGKAVLVINGSRPRTLRVGEVSPENVRLVSATSASAVIEVDGMRQTLTMGQSIAMGGGDAGRQGTILTADAKGHFFANAAINGVTLRFIVDTGASVVTISSEDAKRAGVLYLSGQKVRLQTANGVSTGYRIKLDTVSLGDITLHNVDAVVVEGNALGGVGLLGLSFLNRTEMRRDGDRMSLTRRY
jgi:aspartyl protease family protein